MIQTISVIIPCYNSSDTIEKCICSIYEQKYPIYEIIVIDDGSKDNSNELITALELKKPNSIKFSHIKQSNSGPSVARNRGIKLASGKWIAFLDSDDYWDKDKIKRQIEFVSKHDIFLCGTGTLTKQGYREVSFGDLLKNNYFQTSSVLVKADVMKKVNFNESQKYSEDYRAWLEICYTERSAVLDGNLTHQVISKAFFGERGLSSKLWMMQNWEMKNYKFLLKRGYITNFIYFKCLFFSLIKYFRRVFITCFR